MIGVMVPSVFAVGESIIKEKDCEIIGKELDSNIECRLVMQTPEGVSVDINGHNAQYYDQERNVLYFGPSSTDTDYWKHDYVVVEMDNFTIVDQVQCEGITTGTYVETTTYPCELQIEPKEHKDTTRSAYFDVLDFVQYEENVIFTADDRNQDVDGWGSYCETWVGLRDYDGKHIRWLDDYTSSQIGSECSARNLENKFVQSKTEIPYIYYIVRSVDMKAGLHVIRGDTFTDVHTYKTDKTDNGGHKWTGGSKIFLNEDKNELYYFLGSVIYQINGMGEIKNTPTPTAAVSEPVAEKVSEPVAEKVSEPIQKSSEGCGEGTVLVNGVCQLAPTQSKTTSMSIEPLYIIIGVVAIGGVIGAIAVAKRGSKTAKPVKQDLDEYEEQYLAKQKPSRKPAKKKETSASCSNCGKKLKPTAKFCGSCGTSVP